MTTDLMLFIFYMSLGVTNALSAVALVACGRRGVESDDNRWEGVKFTDLMTTGGFLKIVKLAFIEKNNKNRKYLRAISYFFIITLFLYTVALIGAISLMLLIWGMRGFPVAQS